MFILKPLQKKSMMIFELHIIFSHDLVQLAQVEELANISRKSE